MPVTCCWRVDEESDRQVCSTGFPMGCYKHPSRISQDDCSLIVSKSDDKKEKKKQKEIQSLTWIY